MRDRAGRRAEAAGVRDSTFLVAVAFVLWGLWWGLIDGVIGGAFMAGVVGLLALPWGPLGLGMIGAVVGAFVGVALGVAVGFALASYVTYQRVRGQDADYIAAELPRATTIATALIVGSVALAYRSGLPGWTHTSDVWAWLWLLGVFEVALFLGRKSARSTARWYLGRTRPWAA